VREDFLGRNGIAQMRHRSQVSHDAALQLHRENRRRLGIEQFAKIDGHGSPFESSRS